MVEDVAWLRVEHDSAVGAARRRAAGLAERLGLGADVAAQIGLAVTELGTNLVKHAGHGWLVLRACRGDDVGVQVVALDSGPGMADVEALLVDGRSTTGTLGIGLGALHRLATSYDVYSAPGSGTVLSAAFGDCDDRVGSRRATGLTRPMTGQDVCGDAYAVRTDDGVVSLLLSDGLGHGPLAQAASSAAVRAFHDAPPSGPVELLVAVDRALARTRGAAVAVAQVAGGRVRYAGVGNISGYVLEGAAQRRMVSHPGIVGVNARGFRETAYDLPRHGVLLMHSDGLSDRLSVADRPALLRRTPLVIAAAVVRDYGVRNDDAGVVVLGEECRA